jgi:acyl carrier protein
MEKQTKIRAFVRDLLDRRGDNQPLGEQESLIRSGRLDSINLLEIVSFLEQEFNFDVSGVDFDPDLFDSLENLAKLV